MIFIIVTASLLIGAATKDRIGPQIYQQTGLSRWFEVSLD